MKIEQIARAVSEVSIYSEQSVLDFFNERNHLGQATVGGVVAQVLLTQLNTTEERLATQSRLTINCSRGKTSLEEEYQRLREATGLDDCARFLARATNLARTLALRDGVMLTRHELWSSSAPNEMKYWGIASLAMEQITGIPISKMIAEAESAKLDNQS